MASVNMLTGGDADVYLETGTNIGGSGNAYDGPGAVDADYGPPTGAGWTSFQVAIVAVVALAFIVVLRRNGFRDMVAQ